MGSVWCRIFFVGLFDPQLLSAQYGVGMWRERVDDAGQLLEASSQGALGLVRGWTLNEILEACFPCEVPLV